MYMPKYTTINTPKYILSVYKIYQYKLLVARLLVLELTFQLTGFNFLNSHQTRILKNTTTLSSQCHLVLVGLFLVITWRLR